MKKRLCSLALAALVLLALYVPVMAESGTDYILDFAGLLTQDEREALNSRTAALSGRYGIGIYAVTVEDYNDYGSGTVLDAAKEIYHGRGLGLGDRRDGVLLLLSMRERDWAIFAFGRKAEYAVNDYGREQLAEAFLGNFSGGDWAGGLRGYIEECARYLDLAENGRPVRSSPAGKIIISVLVACAAALTVCLIRKGKRKSVRGQSGAAAYAAGSLTLTEQRDSFSRMDETRRRINDRDHDGGGGGNGGSSGKF